MLEMLTIAAHLVQPLPPEWSARKRLLRERLAEVVQTGNLKHNRNDVPPRLLLERLPDAHGSYRHDRERMKLDLESVNDPEKFWHVYVETIPHEWAHGLNARINGERGHGQDFNAMLESLRH